MNELKKLRDRISYGIVGLLWINFALIVIRNLVREQGVDWTMILAIQLAEQLVDTDGDILADRADNAFHRVRERPLLRQPERQLVAEPPQRFQRFVLQTFGRDAAMGGKPVLEAELVERRLRRTGSKGCKLTRKIRFAAGKGFMDKFEVAGKPGDLMLQHEDRDLLEIVWKSAHQNRPEHAMSCVFVCGKPELFPLSSGLVTRHHIRNG